MPRAERILVVKLATLGDVLTMTPALRALRSSFAGAHIGVLTTPAGAPVLQGLDSFDEILTFNKYAFDRPADAWRQIPLGARFATQLRSGDWDTLVLLHHLTTAFGVAKYAALCLLSGARRRVGLENGRGRWFLTDGAPDHGFGWRHEVDYGLDVVAQLGAHHPGKPHLELALRVPPPAREDSVLLVPGSGAFSKARRWVPERFAQVGRALFERHGLAPRVLCGVDADEQRLAREVAAGIGPSAEIVPPAANPQALGALVATCKLVIANDGGVVHVATAVDTPVVAIFGPSNDRAWGPYPANDPTHHVVREQLACTPCIHRGHSFGTPQGCPARTCLSIVEPGAVVAAAERALGVGSERALVPA